MNKKSHIVRNIILSILVFIALVLWGIASLVGWFIGAIEDEEGTKTHVEKMEETFFSSGNTSEEVYNESYVEEDYYEEDYSEDVNYSDVQEVNSKGLN